jgi:AcrR family transcriptional regulator
MPMPTDTEIDVPRTRGRPRIEGAEILVLAAVADLLESHPVQLITMELVAERAGVSKITLYRRWPSRLAMLVDAMLERLSAVAPLDATKPPAMAIRMHLSSLVKALQGPTGDVVRSVVGACVADPAMAGTLRERYLGHRRALAIQIIGRGQRDGIFSATGSAEVLHDLLYGSVWYRFLFEVGNLNRRQALLLATAVLSPVSEGSLVSN